MVDRDEKNILRYVESSGGRKKVVLICDRYCTIKENIRMSHEIVEKQK